MRSLLALVCCAAIAACGMSKQGKTAPPTAAPEATSGAPSPLPADPRKQIQELEDKFIADRTQLQLDDPGDEMLPGVTPQPMGVQPHSGDPTCRPAPTDTCKTSCTLSDSICSNADKICRLAQDMADDGWAQNKCAKANKTCDASRTKCCGCQ